MIVKPKNRDSILRGFLAFNEKQIITLLGNAWQRHDNQSHIFHNQRYHICRILLRIFRKFRRTLNIYPYI